MAHDALAGLLRQSWIMPLTKTVAPYTAVRSVRYTASVVVAAPDESIGVPRELKTMQAVLAMALPELSRHAGA